jgi:hypothetical protein
MEADGRSFKGVWLCAAIYESQGLSLLVVQVATPIPKKS